MRTMLILASQSPRRAELLKQIGISFKQMNVDVDESVLNNEVPEVYVRRLAQQKSLAGWNDSAQQWPVLGADTVVVINEQILGKPVDQADASRMLNLLSGKVHSVLTSVAITYPCDSGHKQKSLVVESRVTFGPLSQAKIDTYWQSGEPRDKAGSFAIQGLGGQFVKHINGSYSAIVGLPLYETRQLLNDIGFLDYEF
ncbi:MAG: septum formation protein [Paraglaciecola sp.]|jgi:septum formation protein